MKLGTIANRMLMPFNMQLMRMRPNIYWVTLQHLFYKYYHDNFFFIQIGASDGQDAIHELVVRHKMAGLAVEPLPDIFAELRKTYLKYPKVKLCNVAIHRTEREVTLYRVRAGANNVPGWAHGIASLDPSHYERVNDVNRQFNNSEKIIDFNCIVPETVRAESLNTILKNYKVQQIDLFAVDAEGYDAEIVHMLLESECRPMIISLEWLHLKPDAFRDLVILLMDNGYCISTCEVDAIAWRP